MSNLFMKLYNRANKCPVACSLKLALAVGFFYAIHIAIAHQADVSPYPFVLLVALVGLIAVLALGSHLNCQISSFEQDRGID